METLNKIITSKYFLLSIATIFLTSELLLRQFWRSSEQANPENSKQIALVRALKEKELFYQERFCDAVHQTKKGETEVAQCVNKTLSEVKDLSKGAEILTLGASTTHGFNCDSETSWPAELANINSEFRILNLADDGAYSDESINKLEKQLVENKKPAVVVWSHGFTEFLFYGNEKDKNWSQLSLDKELIENLHKEKVYKENFLLKVMRFDITLQKFSYLYRWLRVTGNLAVFKIQDGYLKFMALNSQEGSESTNEREKFIGTQGFLNGPTRMLLSEPAQQYALKNYEINLNRLKDLADKEKFKVICLKIPHVRGLFSYFSQNFSDQFDNWIAKVNVLTKEKCSEMGFVVSDVEQCFNENKEKLYGSQ